MDVPSTAVVLVGRNPTPALLASLTLPVHHVLLVSSDGTVPVARRVAAAVHHLRDDRSARVLAIGADPHDPDAVTALLDRIREALAGRPWYLDYTGGTKIMSVAAALHHERAHPPEAHRLRRYLAPHSAPPEGLGVDLATLAGIHGARWEEEDDPPPVRRYLAGGEAALRRAHPRLPTGEINGIIAEGRVLSHLRLLTRGRPDTEVLGARRVVDPYRPGGSIADFDVLLRHRHRVLCVEVKSRAEDVVARAGWTVAKARRVFGGATRVLFVHTGPIVDDLRERLSAYNPALSARNVHVWHADAFLERVTSFDALCRAFLPALGDEHPRSPASPEPLAPRPSPPRHPEVGEEPLLVTPLGGSRLGALTALHAHRPSRALVLPSKQSLRANVSEAAARTLYAVERPGNPTPDADTLRAEGYRDRVRLAADPVDGFDPEAVAAAVGAWITRERDGARPVVVDFTTGTKAMSLGLAKAALNGGACATYQSAHDRSVVCLRHGRHRLGGRAGPDWSLVLGGYAPLESALATKVEGPALDQVDVALLDLAARRLAAAASGPCRVWWDPTLADGEAFLTARERPTLVLAFGDRAVGLAAPAWRRRRTPDGPPREVRPGAWAQSVFAATTHLGVRCDVAGTLLALTRPGRDVTRAGELVDWIAEGTSGEGGAQGIAFGDPTRPLVVEVDPARPPALLDTDVGLL
ncbi:CRISPR-associated protein [Nocardiopsis sp. MG754419]|uniref:CRISPR-associated protein n=1 Tax=Nocardiopsis sp. MG754419 TaxID=2259865 RepID=UPI001BA8A352|nr:CRISPR-associated protein [Nocardiopsis sp. MG754419]MBR8744489.1 CRISPR-associated protein [Nocardiopsis sp. MG754419]